MIAFPHGVISRYRVEENAAPATLANLRELDTANGLIRAFSSLAAAQRGQRRGAPLGMALVGSNAIGVLPDQVRGSVMTALGTNPATTSAAVSLTGYFVLVIPCERATLLADPHTDQLGYMTGRRSTVVTQTIWRFLRALRQVQAILSSSSSLSGAGVKVEAESTGGVYDVYVLNQHKLRDVLNHEAFAELTGEVAYLAAVLHEMGL